MTLDNIFCFIVITILFLTIAFQALKAMQLKEKTKKRQGGQIQQ
jgi:uncharacterized membrane protein YwzB